MQEEYAQHQVELPLQGRRLQSPFEKPCVFAPQAGGVFSGLADRGGRQVNPNDFSQLGSQQQFSIPDSTPQTERPVAPPGPGCPQNPPRQVGPQRPHRRLGKMPLGESAIQLLVIRQFAG